MRRIFRVLVVVVAFSLLSPAFSFLSDISFARAAYLDENELTAATYIVIDFESGQEICSYNPDLRRPPASMSKMMTVYLVFDAVRSGAISLDSPVPVSEAAFALANDREYTNVPLLEDEVYTVDELLDAAIVVSACGATLALAEFVGGSNEEFLDMMNAKAAEWDIDASFYNVYGGLDEDRTTTVSARAMAIITRNSILEFPEILDKTSKRVIVWGENERRNTNGLLNSYAGLDGFKTGFTNAAGACLAATAKRGDVRLISVVMGTPDNSGRFGDTTMLLDYGFERLRELQAAAAITPTPTPTPTRAPRPEDDAPATPPPLFSPAPAAPSADEIAAQPDVADAGLAAERENFDASNGGESDEPPGGGFWLFVFIFAIVATLCAVTLFASYVRR